MWLTLPSNTVSVINGTTSKVTAVITFKINPPNSGDMYCNGKKFSDNDYFRYDLATQLNCQVKGNTQNEDLTHNKYIDNVLYPIYHFLATEMSQTSDLKFSGWSGYLASKSNPVTINVSKYGILTANFLEVSPYFSRSDLVAIASTILGIAITAFGAWLY